MVDNIHNYRPKTVNCKTLYTTIVDAKQCQLMSLYNIRWIKFFLTKLAV